MIIMRKLTVIGITGLVILFQTSAFGQKFIKSEEPYKAANGLTYHIGDTITLYTPYDYGNKFHYYYMGKNLNPQRAYFTSQMGITKGQLVDYRLTQQVIKQFRKYPEEGMIAVTDKTYGYSVNLDKGLESGEVAGPLLEDYLYHMPTLFSDSIAFLSLLKYGEPLDRNKIKEYFYKNYRSEYNQNREDEFSLNTLLNDKKNEIKDKVNSIDTTQVYLLPVIQKFGSYDFDNNSFPIVWKGDIARILKDRSESWIAKDVNNEGIDLTNLNLYFENTSEFPSFPISPEKAKIVVDKRKEFNGDVDRSLYLAVHFKIKSLADDSFYETNKISKKSKKYFIAHIERIDLFEDKTFMYHYLSTVKNN